jgi:hypothetical protein
VIEGTMRIFFIHVYRRHWEFYPEDEAVELEDAESEEGGFIRWVARKSTRAWRAVHEAETGALGGIRRIIDRLNSRVDPTEPMLQRIRKAGTLEITYPSGISPHYVRRRLRLMLLHKTHTHRRWIVLNGLLVPLTAAMGVVPGPNVFLAWNGYRLISHINAWRGGQRVLTGQIPVTFAPSDELDELLAPEERLIKPLDQMMAATIGQRFGLPGLVEYLHRTGSLIVDER